MITFTITNKHRPKATVVMLVSLYGKQYRKSIGIGVPVKYWNEKKKCAKVTADFDGHPINDAIDTWQEIGKKVVKHFTDLKQSPTQEEFAQVLAKSERPQTDVKHQQQKYICDYFEETYIPTRGRKKFRSLIFCFEK